jgi:peptide-methionine (R)-S-oxide reductase
MASKIDKTEAEWQQKLTPEEFHVCRQCGTEPAFTGEYWDCKTDGVYVCRCCATPLFDSVAKYDSGSGWPSYYAPISAEAVREIQDKSHGMIRTEVRCATCDSHLGHVFPDGPKPTGQRYCINSLSIKLIRR